MLERHRRIASKGVVEGFYCLVIFDRLGLYSVLVSLEGTVIQIYWLQKWVSDSYPLLLCNVSWILGAVSS